MNVICENHGWTLQELGRKLELGKTMLHYLKTGQREPSEKVLRRMVALEESPEIVNLQDSQEKKAFTCEPGPQWPGGESPEDERHAQIDQRFRAIESKMDAIFVVLSEIRNGQNSNFRSSEKPKTTYPKAHE